MEDDYDDLDENGEIPTRRRSRIPNLPPIAYHPDFDLGQHADVNGLGNPLPESRGGAGSDVLNRQGAEALRLIAASRSESPLATRFVKDGRRSEHILDLRPIESLHAVGLPTWEEYPVRLPQLPFQRFVEWASLLERTWRTSFVYGQPSGRYQPLARAAYLAYQSLTYPNRAVIQAKHRELLFFVNSGARNVEGG